MTTATKLKTGSEILEKFIKDGEVVETINNFGELDLTKTKYFMFKKYLMVIDISDEKRPTRMIVREAKRSRDGFKLEQNYYSRNIQQMLQGVEEFINDNLKVENDKIERKAKAKVDQANAISNLKVGDFMVNSWGYEQTNIDFYQVTNLKGKSAFIRPIASKSVEGSGGFMSDRVVPVKDDFCGDEMRKIIKSYGSGGIHLSTSYGSISKYEDGENGTRRSWYA